MAFCLLLVCYSFVSSACAMPSVSLSERARWDFLFVIRLLSSCSKTRFCLLHVRNLK